MTDAELARLYELIRVPSVSADPAYAGDMAVAADLMVAEVALAGGAAQILDLGGHPLVVGEVSASEGFPDAPRVIVYGHYDVQPPGDPDLWTTPAFAPTVRDGQLFARGASDDKGNLFMLVAAVQRLAAAGELPVRVTLLIDGEEESGGDSAMRWLDADTEPAHAAVIFDGPMVGPDHIALCTGLRGLVYRRVTVRTAPADGHSGLFGGGALNAAHALMTTLAAVTPKAGAVAPELTS
jgi:acetylornithine deacetylase/succinyl-diaminopimelate desuccinylase-like protein